jgi:hypothetical protein
VLLFILACILSLTGENDWNNSPSIIGQQLNCPAQKKYFDKITAEIDTNIEVALKRKTILQQIRVQPENRNFNQSWDWFEKEISQLDSYIKKNRDFGIKPPSASFPPLLILIVSTLTFYIFLARLILLHGKVVQDNLQSDDRFDSRLEKWLLPHILFSSVITASMISSEIITSVLACEKTWFGYDSFCVSPSAFVIKCIAFIGFGYVAATPVTYLWCFSRTHCIPRLDPNARDKHFGISVYVEFLQTWSLWLILAPCTLFIVWMRYVVEMELNVSYARVLYAVGIGVPLVLIVVRLIRNAIIIRFRCNQELQKFEEEPKNRVPVDPTISFLGNTWWKLPATIGAALASIWALLEGLGLGKIILSAIG